MTVTEKIYFGEMGDIDSMPPGKVSDVYLRAFGFIKKHHMSVFRKK